MVNEMEEGRNRVLGIMASILVSRHLKTTEDLHDSRPSPRTESLVASAVQWARAHHAEDRWSVRRFEQCAKRSSDLSECDELDASTMQARKKIDKINLSFPRGSVMSGSVGGSSVQLSQGFNTVPLENAVLCVECDVVSDSPHDICMVCSSRSLFNIARVFGGKLPKQRAMLVIHEVIDVPSREAVLPFPKRHRLRRRGTVASRQLPVVALDGHEADKVECGVLLGPKGR